MFPIQIIHLRHCSRRLSRAILGMLLIRLQYLVAQQAAAAQQAQQVAAAQQAQQAALAQHAQQAAAQQACHQNLKPLNPKPLNP